MRNKSKPHTRTHTHMRGADLDLLVCPSSVLILILLYEVKHYLTTMGSEFIQINEAAITARKEKTVSIGTITLNFFCN